MYDYLAKVILIGPSGSGKSCLLHRMVKNEWRILSSQTIGVEFSSKIVKVGTGSRRKRIKLQLWDTAGTERFRSVSRSYYRGAAGAVLVYDVASHNSFDTLPDFLNDARALASSNLTCLLAGNKSDLVKEPMANGKASPPPPTSPSETSSPQSPQNGKRTDGGSRVVSGSSVAPDGLRSLQSATIAPEGREVSLEEASQWASKSNVPVAVEVSAFTGEGVEEVFTRLASIILTKIELGEIDPDDPMSGIQYGDGSTNEDGESVKSTTHEVDGGGEGTPAPSKRAGSIRSRVGTLREWESVFRFNGRRSKKGGGCC